MSKILPSPPRPGPFLPSLQALVVNGERIVTLDPTAEYYINSGTNRITTGSNRIYTALWYIALKDYPILRRRALLLSHLASPTRISESDGISPPLYPTPSGVRSYSQRSRSSGLWRVPVCWRHRVFPRHALRTTTTVSSQHVDLFTRLIELPPLAGPQVHLWLLWTMARSRDSSLLETPSLSSACPSHSHRELAVYRLVTHLIVFQCGATPLQ